MENIIDTILKKETILTITKLNVDDYVNSLTEFINRFYYQKKIVGYTAIVLLVLVLPFYRYTSEYIPRLMQKMFPNDLAFIVYCAILILIVGVPTLIWYKMDTDFKKSKIITLQTLNSTIQSYFENGAKQLNVSVNFNVKEYKQKEGSSEYEIYDYVKLNTEIDSVHYSTRIYISTIFNMSLYWNTRKDRYGNKTKIYYYLYLETICSVPKMGNQQKNIEFNDNGIHYEFTDAQTTFNYGFKTGGKINYNVSDLFTKPFVKNYFDYLISSIRK